MKGIQLVYDRKREDEIIVTLPTSKSMAARALIIGALAGVRPSGISNLPVCTDTTELTSSINSLLDAIPSPADRIGMSNPEPVCLNLNLGLGGTSLRFFTALASSIPSTEMEIDCAAPLKKRPLAPLCEALNTAGAEIGYLGNPGYPPLFIKGTHIPGGEREISASISSQFVSAMIMCAPYWKEGLKLSLTGHHPVSFPYIDMTMKMMQRAGAEVGISDDHRIISVGRNQYIPSRIGTLSPEADWSAASYFYELALVLPERRIEISSLTPPHDSLQGDSKCAEIFNLLGVVTTFNGDGSASLTCDKGKRDSIASLSTKSPIELDMSATPDLVPALAVGMCLAGIRFNIIGISHLHLKESDRITALQIELEKIGYSLEAGHDFLSWNGGRTPVGENEAIDTYHDHRIAMAFAVAAVSLPYLYINDPQVIEKSFPDYFDILKKAGFKS
ncbi:MAG: 3-phosphoshikimate 1-carboxyvinyltransferase [Muribaculaceae bacterium]|nr:3-phosphoshikimate 1-carboxyvinyltransferase [Muribaculaceae bacterium]